MPAIECMSRSHRITSKRASRRNSSSDSRPLVAVMTVGVAAKVSGTTETYQWNVIQSASANLGTPDILASYPFTNAQAASLLTAGSVLVFPVPPGSITKRYLGLYFDGANTPTITVTAWFAPQSMVDRRHDYATRISVL